MSFEVSAVAAADVHDEVVDLLWEHRHWPLPTREEYARTWAWRQSHLSDGATSSWVARSQDGRLIGHIALYHRTFRTGGREIHVGVPGDLLVHRDCRDTVVGARLMSIPRAVVKRGELDAILAFANARSNALFLRLGFRELGRMHTYTDWRHTAPVLARRLGPAAAVAPVLDAALALRRNLKNAWRSAAQRYEIVPLSAAEFARLDVSHWVYPENELTGADRPEWAAARYLDCYFTPRTAHALVCRGSGRCDGYVILEGGTAATVVDCKVNAPDLCEVAAITHVAHRVGDCLSKVQVPTLPGTALADTLVLAGFMERPPTDGANLISAYWPDESPNAPVFARREGWHLLIGANHH